MIRPLATATGQVATLRTALSVCVCAWMLWATELARCGEASVDGAQRAAMEERILQRLAERPNDASSWRMLGRIRFEHEDREGAYVALSMAVQLDPLSAAAHFDLGRVLVAFDRREAAREHFRQAADLAPESQYAEDARKHLKEIAAAIGDDKVEQADYEVKSFTGVDDLKEKVLQEPPPPDRLYFHMETGALYNSNVGLTPIDRELAADSQQSAQGFVQPELEYYAFENDTWRGGPALSGYFNLNEGPSREFNVQSYQPGVFLERTIDGESATLVPRVQYDFSHDEFDGSTFGNRHALTTSAAAHWRNGQKSFAYWTIDFTDFLDDGTVPSVSSQDGWTNTIGLSHKVPMERRYLRSLRAGVEFERADLDGSDFAYNGVGVFGEADVPLARDWSLLLQLGWGFRDYFDFESSPSRDENIWQAGVELRRRINEHLMVAGVFNYDRFDSKNTLFEAERFLSGVVLTIDY